MSLALHLLSATQISLYIAIIITYIAHINNIISPNIIINRLKYKSDALEKVGQTCYCTHASKCIYGAAIRNYVLTARALWVLLLSVQLLVIRHDKKKMLPQLTVECHSSLVAHYLVSFGLHEGDTVPRECTPLVPIRAEFVQMPAKLPCSGPNTHSLENVCCDSCTFL